MRVDDQSPSSESGREIPFILRDRLAAHRTVLANERTLLAYIRTALALGVSGVTFVHFFPSRVIAAVGWCFVPLGVALLVVGLARYRHERRRLRPHRAGDPNDVGEVGSPDGDS